MIRSLTGSRYVSVNNGNPSPTYMNPSPGALNVGQVRFNTSLQGFEVYDGFNWLQIQSGHTHLDLTGDAASAIDWARQKMQEEQELKRLMDKHPGLKDLYDKFEMLKVLCQQEEKEQDGA